VFSNAKKVLAGIVALAALALGGAALAGAAGNSTAKAPSASEQPGTETSDKGGANEKDGQEAEPKVSPADAKQAEAAALGKVGSGKATEVAAETPNPNEAADKPEKGETPDPAYESQIAYTVEVTEADGSVVDVALDKSFGVLGTEAAEQHDGEHGDQDEKTDTAGAKD
jgi:hypothetical protein